MLYVIEEANKKTSNKIRIICKVEEITKFENEIKKFISFIQILISFAPVRL